jgi:hypothetical protein
MMTRATPTTILFLAAALLLGSTQGCAERNELEPIEEEGVSPVSPDLIYASGWTKVEIDANSAKTTVDPAGHYSTDRNMCQRRGDAVYSVPTWNAFAESINAVIRAQPLSPPRCSDAPGSSRFYNRGLVTVNLEPVSGPAGKRLLYEHKNGQICSTIANEALSHQLLALVEQTILLADKADAIECPNYRP